MSDLDPEEFEAEKYVEYFPKLQTAYRRAFETVNERYDSQLVHALDQQVLNESEPFYEGEGRFRIEVPEDPADRIEGVVVSDDKVERLLDVYVEELQTELRRVFGFKDGE